MCGYTSYSDGRLIPPDVNDHDEPEDAERLHEECVHGRACWRQARDWCEGLDGDMDELIRDPEEMLGCVECHLYERAR